MLELSQLTVCWPRYCRRHCRNSFVSSARTCSPYIYVGCPQGFSRRCVPAWWLVTAARGSVFNFSNSLLAFALLLRLQDCPTELVVSAGARHQQTTAVIYVLYSRRLIRVRASIQLKRVEGEFDRLAVLTWPTDYWLAPHPVHLQVTQRPPWWTSHVAYYPPRSFRPSARWQDNFI